MAGDYFTKPLQGDKFREFRDKILNIQLINDGSTPIEGSNPHDCVRYLVHKLIVSPQFWGV